MAYDQEQKYKDLLQSYTILESEWKNMEQYIHNLNDYQNHIESKYE